jgi:hypothetical protein
MSLKNASKGQRQKKKMMKKLEKNSSIEEHEAFKACGGGLIGQLIGGSTLYGLNTPESDVDYRGVFFARSPLYTSGLHKIDSIVQTGEIDSVYYELRRFFELLRKSNTQVAEILFAPHDSLSFTTPLFNLVRRYRYSLIDTDMMKASLKGYVFSEIRLATGQRSGQLGGKRKKAVEAYGFSPKNFVQILRLCAVGKVFFETGEYMVRVSDYDKDLHEHLMDIKLNPEKFTCEELSKEVEDAFRVLTEAMDNSKISHKFNTALAAEIITRHQYQLYHDRYSCDRGDTEV